MTQRKDFTNHVAGKLTVLQFSHTGKKGRAYWLCACACGNKTTVEASKLASGRAASCGCARVLPKDYDGPVLVNEYGNCIADISGQTFGQLTILRYSHTDKKRGSFWHTRCSCGNEKTMAAGLFRRDGSSKSCGCLMGDAVSASDKYVINPVSGRRLKDISGTRYANLTVVSYSHSQGPKHFWQCCCDCGSTIVTESTSLTTGNTQSCGCIKGLARRLDVNGQRFGRLIVLSIDDEKSASMSRTYRLCQCDCGNLSSVEVSQLTGGHTQSCGCLYSENSSKVGSAVGIHNAKATSRYDWHIIVGDQRIYLRSGFELIYAQYLVRNRIQFVYEPELFILTPSTRYRPDFYLVDTNTWVEVKGYQSSSFPKKKQLFEQLVGQSLVMVTQDDLPKYLPVGTSYNAWMKENAPKYKR